MSERASVDAVDADAVPCPREAWRAAFTGRRVSVTVQPDSRAASSGGAFTISGDITGRRKVGDDHTCYVTLRFIPDGELAPVELEAAKEGGAWGAFRVFHWKQPRRPTGPEDHAFQYVGRAVRLDLPGVRASEPDVESAPEVSA